MSPEEVEEIKAQLLHRERSRYEPELQSKDQELQSCRAMLNQVSRPVTDHHLFLPPRPSFVLTTVSYKENTSFSKRDPLFPQHLTQQLWLRRLARNASGCIRQLSRYVAKYDVCTLCDPSLMRRRQARSCCEREQSVSSCRFPPTLWLFL
jgi:hypothetical protein